LVLSSISTQSYSGKELNFEVASGTIIFTNPSDQSIPASFQNTSTRTFRVSSNVGISGNSVREGAGNRSHLFEFMLPRGTSEFSIDRGTNVTFSASSDVVLEAVIQPMTLDSTRFVTILGGLVILGLLYYASSVMEHRWIRLLTGKSEDTQEIHPVVDDSGQGKTAKSFGDNRA
jgi:hypothetical protein